MVWIRRLCWPCHKCLVKKIKTLVSIAYLVEKSGGAINNGYHGFLFFGYKNYNVIIISLINIVNSFALAPLPHILV
jgi:hypothetical protein